jgi:hypothetical protein
LRVAVLQAGPGVRPGERDEDEDDGALSEDASVAGAPALEADPPGSSQNESHAGTSSVAPNARDQDTADD